MILISEKELKKLIGSAIRYQAIKLQAFDQDPEKFLQYLENGLIESGHDSFEEWENKRLIEIKEYNKKMLNE